MAYTYCPHCQEGLSEPSPQEVFDRVRICSCCAKELDVSQYDSPGQFMEQLVERIEALEQRLIKLEGEKT